MLRLTVARIRRLVRQLDAEGEKVATTGQNLARAMQLRDALMEAIDRSGFRALAREALDEPLERAALPIRPVVATETAFDVAALQAFKDVRYAQLLQLEDDVAAALWRTVVDGVTGARAVDDLLDDLEDILDSSRTAAQTTYDTAVSTYVRQVQQTGATGEPDELFVYVGPVDSKMRPFCRQRVGRVYPRKQIESWDNGQLPNPMLTGGGYNCRHLLLKVSELDAEVRALAGTAKRLPEVEALLDDAS